MSVKKWPADINEYELGSIIGNGNFSKVYLAENDSRKCVIKKIDCTGNNINIYTVKQELTAMRMCNHPNILNHYRSFYEENMLYIIMPFSEHGSLQYIISARIHMVNDSTKPLFQEKIIAIITHEICKGLEHLHSRGWVHRDIKSPNILINKEGHVQITDFGVVGMKEDSECISNTNNAYKTFVGTVCWMAPEIMTQHNGYNNKVDIWSLGICVLELLKGYPPYYYLRPMKSMLRTIRDEPPCLDTYKEFEIEGTNRNFSINVKHFVKQLLHKNPELRPSATKCMTLAFIKKFSNSETNRKILCDELLCNLDKLE